MADFASRQFDASRPRPELWLAPASPHRKKKRARAFEVAGEETYKTYMKYLADCAKFFRSGEVNVYQYWLRVA